MKSVCVYCGSATGVRPLYAAAARSFSQALVEAGIELVYGGGKVGLMGVLADEAMARGGRVTGVIPELLLSKEVGHTGLTELRVVPDMHQRKKLMADLSDAFVAMPGGVGTLEELFEVYTWSQLGYHQKPVALLNINGYYDPLLEMLRHTVREGFMQQTYLDILQVDHDPQALIGKLLRYAPPSSDKWSTHRSAV
ncbi:TIGR00730 family Rossman fold protein [Paraburkholderia bonniea]|uniref:LOG family protein n=1 Tax=Paraburkholderia bonniea TaxID=2152891 RepID=UPI001291157A|nr:TIGR00730 family Rossman fold protein [Paraburkholderia bonniea]WJF91612.1 TIGR00730 family Rossman fold protein [Paraburkholderia bonniea]WJF94931.1 TIGR00730 family Rossman fold protein [Paraburkholderia bonniea]